MIYYRNCIFAGILLITIAGYGQEKTSQRAKFNPGRYIDIFYGYDFNVPETKQRLPYIYHHNRHNSFNVNHGVASLAITHPKYRANFAIQAGTYVTDNYTSEPDLLKIVFDANAGLALNQSQNLWLDVGIFGNSFIGFENTFSHPNANLGHNLVSENVPYFMTGVKASHKISDQWAMAILLLNGWQRIKWIEGNSLSSLGTELTYSRNNFSFDWSSFTGTDDPDSTRRMHFFNNLYSKIKINEHWRTTLGIDFGVQQKSKGASETYSWWGMAAIVRYIMNEHWSASARYEHYSDPMEVIVTSIDPASGYKTSGYSANLDYHFLPNLQLRLEVRRFVSKDPIYPETNTVVTHNLFLLTALTFQWE